MDTRNPIQTQPSTPLPLNSSFNQNLTSISVSTTTGYSVYSLSPHPVLRTSRDLGAPLHITEMIETSNLLAIVGCSPPSYSSTTSSTRTSSKPSFPSNHLIIWDDAKLRPIITLTSPLLVLGVRISRSHIVIVTLTSVTIYSFASSPTKIASFETASNDLGLACLNHPPPPDQAAKPAKGTSKPQPPQIGLTTPSSALLAFPGLSPGKIQLYSLPSQTISIIPAHTSAIRAMTLSKSGDLLATASEQGTLIRIFSTINCARLCEVRRGVDPAKIFDLGFSSDSRLVAATSERGTLHVFDLNNKIPGLAGQSNKNEHGSRSGKADQANRGRSESPKVNLPKNLNVAEPGEEEKQNKWGFLSMVPLLPRIFSDTYSDCTCSFDISGISNDTSSGDGAGAGFGSSSPSKLPLLGTSLPTPRFGKLVWADERTIMVVGTGREGKWEKFRVGEVKIDDGKGGELMKWRVWREGWKGISGN